MRSLVRRLALWQWGGKKPFGLGLITKKGRPVWESLPQEETHAFRRYVYEKLLSRDGQDPKPAGRTFHPSPGTG